MWFTTPADDGSWLRVHVFREDIDEIRSGFNPDEYYGCSSVVIKKMRNMDDEKDSLLYVLEDETEINDIIANDRRRDLIYLHS